LVLFVFEKEKKKREKDLTPTFQPSRPTYLTPAAARLPFFFSYSRSR
jgi:hypothetical protein